jgi:hypothetical protein
MRIITLLARHGTSKYPKSLEDVQDLFRKQLAGVEHHCVVADNSLPAGHFQQVSPHVVVIGASNAAWEFSAWDSAVQYLGPRLQDFDFVHLATSAFRQLYVRYLDRFNEEMLARVKGRAAAIGHVDYYNHAVTLRGCRSQAWLRTSFVFLPPREVYLLGSFVGASASPDYFSGNPASPFHPDAPVSEGYRRNILGWLVGDGTGQGTEWHSRFKLTHDTLGFFESKVIAIFNEQMLTNRLRAQGCAVVDATWLAGCECVLGAIPDWRIQVASRDTDAAPASLLN